MQNLRMLRHECSCAFALGTMILSVLASVALAAEPVVPGKTWTSKTPGEARLDAARLDAMRDFIGGRGCVVRGGHMVYTWGDQSRRGDVASACKPWYTHFLLTAIEAGKLTSVEEAVERFEPRLKEINAARGHKDRRIQWKHLANQVSCYGVREEPGRAYDYSDFNMALFFDTLFLKVYGSSWARVDDEVLRPMLTDVLACEDDPTFMAFGTKNRPGRVGVSVRDFARFGLLYLRDGKWRDKQLVSPGHVKLATRSPRPNSIPRTKGESAEMIPGQRSIGGGNNQTDHHGSYSYAWWTNGVDRNGARSWPDVPTDAFGAFGHGGKRVMAIIPSLDLIVVWNDSRIKGRKMEARALALLVAAVTDGPAGGGAAKNLGDVGRFAKWAKVEIVLRGPNARGRGTPNPFAKRVDVRFTAPSGKSVDVPGFYDGDGRGELDGAVWKVRFSADEIGTWRFASKSTTVELDGHFGTFSVTAGSGRAAGFYRWGRLEAVGTAENGIRYLKFRDGPYWLKAGCDDPENFLGRFSNYDTLPKRKAAIDYLAARGINSLYIMTHNIGGDHRDVWCWLGDNEKQAKSNGGNDARFDVAKLAEWRALFEHMQEKGVVPYLVLEDDSAWKGYDHARYYRELVARFGDLPGLVFNVGEEHNENYSLSAALGHMRRLAAIDPYDHPRGIHNVNQPNDQYIDSTNIDFTAIQTGSGGRPGKGDALGHNRLAIEWIERCRSRGQRVLMVGFDEGRPEANRRSWWSAYLGGGVWEAHVTEPYDRPMSAWETTWTELGGARAFLESLPFWEMQPANELVTAGTAFCLAKPGLAYALYLPEGGSVTVELASGRSYELAWWKPTNGRDGGFARNGEIEGGRQRLTAPGAGDWALRIRKR